MRIMTTLLVFYLTLLIVGTKSDTEFIGIDPFVSHLEDCYVHLIFYTHLNFESPSLPIVISTPRFDLYSNSSLFLSGKRNISFASDYSSGSIGFEMCSYVLQNYLLRGVNCLGVVAVRPNATTLEEEDIYWYLNHYWSRMDLQAGENTEKAENVAFETFVSPFFPTEIYILTIVADDIFASREKMGAKNIEVSNFWRSFTKIPILTFVTNKIEMSLKKFKCRVLMSIGGIRYFKEFNELLGNQGKLSDLYYKLIENHFAFYYTCFVFRP